MQYTNQADVDKVVKRMVEKAYENSTDPSFMSPFALLGSQMLSWEYQGGKPDDITIMLAAITDSLDPLIIH